MGNEFFNHEVNSDGTGIMIFSPLLLGPILSGIRSICLLTSYLSSLFVKDKYNSFCGVTRQLTKKE